MPVAVVASVAAGFWNGTLTQLQVQCGTIDIASDGSGGWTTTVLATPRGIWTTISSGPTTIACPAGEVVVGLEGTAGSTVNQMTLHCAPITVTGDAASGLAVSYGTITSSSTLGTTAGASTYGPVDCAAGTIGAGFQIGSGDIIDSIALRCDAPVIAAP